MDLPDDFPGDLPVGITYTGPDSLPGLSRNGAPPGGPFLEVPYIYRAWGPFLERPGKLTGPVSYFEIEVSRKVGRVLIYNEVHFVSLAENSTV